MTSRNGALVGAALLAVLAASGGPASAQEAGRWVFSPHRPDGGPGRCFGWRGADFGDEYSGLLLVCRAGNLRPGQVRVTTSLGAAERRGPVEMRIGDGARTVLVGGEATQGVDEVSFDAALVGSHPLFGLLAEAREDQTLSVAAPGSRGRATLPWRGAAEGYRRFAHACDLQVPPDRD